MTTPTPVPVRPVDDPEAPEEAERQAPQPESPDHVPDPTEDGSRATCRPPDNGCQK
ncbi:hypothetical protein [Kitasatospora sp. LaBMicrA B282]|uniref:hypothetical protein n=1 Tax=Kitasatospora sp. LaBMicrA B282 TaxID=3420949 RepID=UPI003D12DE11